MPCPYLKEVVMLYCDACAVKKMIPLDRLVSADPCLAQRWKDCPVFRSAEEPDASGEKPEPTPPRREATR